MIYTCGPLTLLSSVTTLACRHAPRRGRRHWLTDFRPRSSRAFGEGCTCVVVVVTVVVMGGAGGGGRKNTQKHMQTLAPWDDLYPFIDILYIYTHFFFLFLHPFIYIYIILLFQIKLSSYLDNQSSALRADQSQVRILIKGKKNVIRN